ncbi:EF-hand domain-containing protein [Engelhardtia mirabilis]|uniref:EF-hand domain-containing protein n=1 Tax=Engelhardtia mirabilis TaxID=2528011 RepID=A0A518BRM7_9BACT|nr:hypothetical protein Pla133_47520 [Planctomycetes bacterium Pla133]QDV03957.1 hypothetical protein Pla86_47500 [Planctomycetes bacterium Pla86]
MHHLLGQIALGGLTLALLAAGAPGAGAGQELATDGPGVRLTEQEPVADPLPGPAGHRRAASAANAASHDLRRASATFGRADSDRDGSIGWLEAVRTGLSSREFRAFDADTDGSVSRDEFIVGYRRLVNAAGQRTAPDLDAETTRIEAFRRAFQAQAQHRASVAGDNQPSGPGARRVQDARSDALPSEEQIRALEASEPPAGPAARRRAASQGAPGAESERGAVPTARPGGGASPAPGGQPAPVVRPTPATSRGASPVGRSAPSEQPASRPSGGTERPSGERPRPTPQPATERGRGGPR